MQDRRALATNSRRCSGFVRSISPRTSLRVAADGRVQYGAQKYAAVVIYHPEFEGAAMADFIRKAAHGATALYRLGKWTMGPDAAPFDGDKALAGTVELPSARLSR